MMKKTGCKSLLLVTLVMVLGLLTSCSETAVYRYRFSPATGFQEEDGDIWYEMSDAPMVIQKEEGTITIKNIIWKEKRGQGRNEALHQFPLISVGKEL